MKIYLFSGLGADERLFDNLSPIPGYEYETLKCVKPGTAISLADYAKILVDQYHFEPPFLLGGVSIGGMIAQEIAQLIQPEMLILISTVRFRNELPEFLRIVNSSFTRSLLEKSFLEKIAAIGDKFTKKSAAGRKLFYDMLHDSDRDFMKFGAGATLGWHPPQTKVPFIRLHGTEDKVFPISRIKGECIEIKNGAHFMTFEKGEKISGILRDKLTRLTDK